MEMGSVSYMLLRTIKSKRFLQNKNGVINPKNGIIILKIIESKNSTTIAISCNTLFSYEVACQTAKKVFPLPIKDLIILVDQLGHVVSLFHLHDFKLKTKNTKT